ncbi:MAG TPA: class I SAM-dependent methyltransferase [Pseudolabrys sp.]|nr:class I SAM-dependent methyltransferase [Pseudolabrys sp.]
MGSAEVQGELWGARAREWAELQELSFRSLYEAAFKATHLGKDSALLDVGCGAGLALQIAQAHGARVAGIDASEGLVAIAQGRSPGADIRVGDIEDLPFADHSFDIVTGFNSFQYAGDPVRALTEARRVTRPNGYVLVAVWGAADHCELAPYLAALGKLLPPPPPGARGPFSLSAPGALEELVGEAGLRPEGIGTVRTAMTFPDEATAVRGLLASGVAERAIRHSGEAAVSKGIAEAIKPSRTTQGSYSFRNEWRFLTSRA